ncbi:acyltransferase [Ligilactobacillus salitolerans]|uniref:Acyltransferase n=1 Tax=Ligilactobacillus salitolerans TaxID=1808352 RepID=A0A401IW05_9LACO|nr:acyltransferase family protein [Ligilactobacillus salitolerans]GBG95702.1 acyltransferase [Ligilactobacillus salitolerans]
MEFSSKPKRVRIKWFSLVRITGLFLVLGYHFFQNTYPGGFIGVDVFFAFSGFLITALMIDEFTTGGAFSLAGFYQRRFYRIVPPLILSVLIVVPFTYLVGSDFITGLGKQIAAAFGFVTNYFEIATGGSYENNFIPHLFVHTWSLAVEMHFYIGWGLLVWLFSWLIRILPLNARSQNNFFRFLLGIVSLMVACLSVVAMKNGGQGLKDFSPVYFSTWTHIFPFFFGAFLSTLTGIAHPARLFEQKMAKWSASRAIILMVLGLASLLALTFGIQFKDSFTYPFGMLLSVICACLMILGARILHEQTPTLNEPKIITFIADCSYSVYLYHWPLYVIFAHRMSNGWAAVWTTVLSFLFAAFSYYIVEPLVAGRAAHLFGTRVKGPILTRPLLVLVAGLLVLTGTTVWQSPRMSKLERNLWIGGIYQDVDGINHSKDAVMAQVKPPKKPKQPQKPAGNTHDYREYNKDSLAKKYHLPAGVSIIGDSVTLGTRRYLEPNVADSQVDAEGDRTLDKAYKVLMTQQKNKTLREFVVICVGTNALNDYEEQAKKIINDIEPGHKLVIMTPYDAQATPSWNSSKLAEFEKTLPGKYKWITIADWGKAASEHPDVFKGTDGVHFAGRPAGDHLYAQTVNQGLIEAAKKPAKTK